MALYDAFVSYSHAKDKPIAAALQSVVQKLGKPWYRRRALRVFRDDTSLSATPHLWPAIEQALGRSRYFILLASPEAAASKWVNKEVAYWLEHNGVDTLLIGVTDGELAWDDAINDFARRDSMPLPPVLAGRFSVEPKWVDLRAYRDGADPRDAKFIELGADFAAAIRGMPKEDLLSQEVRQQRRALTLAWSGIGTLVVLMALAGWQWLEAVTERDNAMRNFKLAKSTADSLVFDISRGLRNEQGISADGVRKILETAKGTFEQLAAAARDDFELQASRAAMLKEFGDTYLTLGDLEQALKAYRDGLAINEHLTVTDRGKMQWQRDLSVSHNKVGDVLVQQGQFDEALKAYREGLAIRERLAAADRGNTHWQRDLSMSYGRIGDLLMDRGQLQEALKAYRDGLAIQERLAAADRSNTEWQRDLKVSRDRIGIVLEAQGEHDEALKAYRDGLAFTEPLAAAEPGNTRWQRDLTVSYDSIGNVLKAQGRLDEALRSYRDGLAVNERLTAADRGNTQWQQDRSLLHVKVGEVLLAQDKLDEALQSFLDGLAIRKRLAAADGSNTRWQRDLTLSHNRVAEVLLAQNKLDEALHSFRDGLAIRKRLAAADGGNASWQRDLSISYDKVGNVLVDQGKLDEALEAYRDGLAIRERLAAADRSNAQWQNDLQYSIDRGGDLAYRFALARDFARALEVADQAISLAPDNVKLYANRAHALMFLGRASEARALYLQYRGAMNVQDEKSWETIILEDFAELRKAGLTHPLMDEIEKRFAAAG